jgi:hypothetical protein
LGGQLFSVEEGTSPAFLLKPDPGLWFGLRADAGVSGISHLKAGRPILAAGRRRAAGRSTLQVLDKVASVGPDTVAPVYLLGFGLQFNGDNNLVPVDAEIARVRGPAKGRSCFGMSRGCTLAGSRRPAGGTGARF